MSLINVIGSFFNKFTQGFTFGTKERKVTVRNSATIEIEVDGNIDVTYEYSFPQKSGTVALLDDIEGGSSENIMGVIVHGSSSGSIRPSGFNVVTWIGSVEPINAIDDDIWYNNNF